MRKSVLLAATAVSFVLSASAHAAITFYDSQSAYLAAIAGAAVDDFEDLAPGALPESIARTVGPYSYTASAFSGDVPAPLYAVETDGDTQLSVFEANYVLAFRDFSSTVAGVGGFFYSTDLNGNVAPSLLGLQLIVFDDAGGVAELNLTGATSSTFLGFVSDSSISALIFAPNAEEGQFFVTVNDLTLGAAAAIPEPATWAMMMAGFALAGATLRRRALTVSFA